MYNKMLLKKLLKIFVAHIFTLLLAPFTFKLANHSKHSEISEDFEIDVIFLQKHRFYRFQIDQFGWKGAKRSLKMWPTKLYQAFFKNILLYMNGRLSKTVTSKQIWISYSIDLTLELTQKNCWAIEILQWAAMTSEKVTLLKLIMLLRMMLLQKIRLLAWKAIFQSMLNFRTSNYNSDRGLENSRRTIFSLKHWLKD